MNADQLIVVTGATGKQGGAVADHLLKAGFRVRAITRNPASAAAEKLKQKEAELVTADMEDKGSLTKALAGAYGVFSVQNYWEKGVGYEGEVRQGKNLIAAARETDIRHFVQASVADAENAPGVKHFECKAVLEKALKESGLPHTILGETFFMENFFDPNYGSVMFPMLGGYFGSETRFHMVSVKDIGAIATTVFQNPELYIGQKVNIAGDCLTLPEMKAIYNRVMPKKAPGYSIPSWVSGLLNAEMSRQLKWNRSQGWHFGLDEVRKVNPQLTSFEQFLQSHR